MRLSSSRALLLLVSLAASACGPPPALVDWVAEQHPDVLFRVHTADSVVALTLDDGPHPALTPAILDVLAAHDARATFFLTGSSVPGREDVVRRIVAEGHELGNHMMTTRPSITLSLDAFRTRLLDAHHRLAAFGPVRWLRPASGFYAPVMLRLADSLGYRVALGSVYPNDAQNPFPGYHARYILRHARPGAVIILHEGASRRWGVLEVLRRVLPELRRRGYRVVTLSELAPHDASDGRVENPHRHPLSGTREPQSVGADPPGSGSARRTLHATDVATTRAPAAARPRRSGCPARTARGR